MRGSRKKKGCFLPSVLCHKVMWAFFPINIKENHRLYIPQLDSGGHFFDGKDAPCVFRKSTTTPGFSLYYLMTKDWRSPSSPTSSATCAPEARRPTPSRPMRHTARLAPTTVNRILAAVSTFYAYLILTEDVSTNENPLRKTSDLAAARVVPRYVPFLHLTTRQRPVRRVRSWSNRNGS